MTKKISPWLRRDARSMFGNMCIGATHTKSTNQPTNQPLAVGMRRVQAADDACANFHPFPGIVDPHCSHPSPLPDLFRLRIPSDLFSRSAPGLFFTFHRRRRRLRVSAPISLDRGFFAILFAPSLSHPETSPDSGGGGEGVQRVQPSVLGLSLVSLVTAPHKGIAL